MNIILKVSMANYDEWKKTFESPESIAFLEGFGISGVSYGQSIPKYYNVIKGNGVGVIDFFQPTQSTEIHGHTSLKR